jgi:predicted kinase
MTHLSHQTVVIVAGAPGAGKSTVAERLALALPAAPVDIDVVFEPVVPLLAAQPREAVRAAVYESLAAIAEASLAAGFHVVVSAPFTLERQDRPAWERLEARLSSGGAAVALVWLHAPADLLLARLAARGAARDAAKLADPGSWLREVEPETPPVVPHVAVDALQPADEAAASILRELAERDRASSLANRGREACSSSA